MSQITPGPWHVDMTVALGAYGVWTWGDEHAPPYQICSMRPTDSDLSREARDANARLIAQSPDLLAFIREVVADLDCSQAHCDLRPEYADMLRRGLELLARVDGEGAK